MKVLRRVLVCLEGPGLGSKRFRLTYNFTGPQLSLS